MRKRCAVAPFCVHAVHGICKGAGMDNKNHESEIALHLANRAYVYGALRVVFGALPSADVVQRIASDNTKAALGDVLALCRASLGGEPGPCVGLLGVSAERCLTEAIGEVEKLKGLVDADAEAIACKLKSDYSRLFDIPGDSYVHTWESPYVGTEGTLFQASTLNVREYYHEAGYRLQAEKHFPDDHIAAMMDYLRCMGEKAYNEYADGLDRDAASTLDVQVRFLKQHVLTWADVFASRVVERDGLGYYAAFAKALAAFAQVDYAFAGGLAKELAAV